MQSATMPIDCTGSSCLERAEYNHATNKLRVKFLGSGEYVYSDVPPNVAADFGAAPSKGKFLLERIRDVYPHQITDFDYNI
jgi:hypothetical protein